MSVTYQIGFSAYYAAVQGGYTGTYAEFCAQQAGYAESAAEVETLASEAAASATAAATSATEAATSATSAATSEANAATSEANAATSASEAEASATSAAASAALSGTATNIADGYDTTATYAVGDYVLYGDVLYRCITAWETAGEFDSDYWMQVTAGEELTRLSDETDMLFDKSAEIAELVDGTSLIQCTLANGTIANSGNSNAVNTSNYIPCKYGDTVTMYPARRNTAGYYYQYAYTIYDSSYSRLAYDNGASEDYASITITNLTAAYIRFSIFEYNGSSYNPLRVATYGATPYAVVATTGGGISGVLNSSLHDYNTEDMWEVGSLGSNGADYYRDYEIRTNIYIPLDEIIKIVFDDDVYTRFCLYDSSKTFIVRTSDIPAEVSTEWLTTRWTGAAYIRFTLYTDETAVTDLSNYSKCQIIAVKRPNFGEEQFYKANFDYYYDLLSQARYAYAGTDSTADERILTLLHFSDVHDNYASMTYALSVYNTFSDKIDDMLHTGDTVSLYFSQGIDNWIISGCAPQVLNVIGNHDSEDSNLVLGAASKEDVYNLFFAPYISNWGVTQPDGVDDSTSDDYCALYYYKDYTDPMIRLIILDTNYWDDAETAWLTATLEDANTNGYAVILACHNVKLLTEMTDSNFSAYPGDGITETSSTYGNQPDDWLDPVTDFVNDGGEFICMLAGHNHSGHMGTLTNYPDIFCFVCDKAGINRTSGMARISGELNQNTVNIVTINATEKLFKIVRIGAEVDGKMRGKHVFCYDYGNAQIISQW